MKSILLFILSTGLAYAQPDFDLLLLSTNGSTTTTPPYEYYAVSLVDGHLVRDSGLSTALSTTTGTISMWMKMDESSSDTGIYELLGGENGPAFKVNRDADGGLTGFAGHTGSQGDAGFSSDPNTFIKASGWVHLIFSWDWANSGRNYAYLNGLYVGANSATYQPAMNWAGITQWAVGGNYTASHSPVLVAEVFVHPGWINLYLESNRRKFRTPEGKPADLGADGSLPMGSQPLLYFKGTMPGFASNLGSGGTFTELGTIANTSDKP